LQDVQPRLPRARRLGADPKDAGDGGDDADGHDPAAITQPAEAPADHGGERQGDEGDVVERLRQARMGLRQHSQPVLTLPGLGQVGEQQLMQIAVGDLVVNQLIGAGELRQVQGVVVEGQVVQHAGRAEELAGAVLHD
jgi:hypothetical protein